MKRSIWISYDLGVKGDYTGFYTWLDSHKAKECGDSLAYLQIDIKSTDTEDQIVRQLLDEIEESVEFNKTDRIYLTFKSPDTNDVKGKFIKGGRKRAPWEGYSGGASSQEEDQ